MPIAAPDHAALISDLQELAGADKWDFRSWAAREDSHGLFQYPAMMVPQMQRELLERLRDEADGTSVYDPFVGSGTTMAEAMLLGLNFVGTDINPLAVLLCRAKAGPFFIDALRHAADRVVDRAARDRRRTIELVWQAWPKWFRRDVAVDLSRLRRAIRGERQLVTRRFLWVCLAETVRLTSNSRTSTVKLHVRPADEIRERAIDARETFARILRGNLKRFTDHRDALRDANLLHRGHYSRSVEVYLHDVRTGPPPGATSKSRDLLLTSPPYGDNVTTVPYGQHAYLPLQWIDLHDIDDQADERFLATTYAIDSMSLGAPTRGALEAVAPLRATSPSLDELLGELADEPRDRGLRVAAFWRDVDGCLDDALGVLMPGALMAWTVGNRRVGGRQVPMDRILGELLAARGCEAITTLRRTIPDCRKRMASRNSVAATMNAERVLVVRSRQDAEDG
jgi:hypothetical protein